MELCYLGQSFFLCDSSSVSLSMLFSCSVESDSLRPHGPQHAGPPCSSPTPGAGSNSGPLSQWCLPTMSSSVAPFASCPQFFPASEASLMSQLFASGRQSTGALASGSVLPMMLKLKLQYSISLTCNKSKFWQAQCVLELTGKTLPRLSARRRGCTGGGRGSWGRAERICLGGGTTVVESGGMALLTEKRGDMPVPIHLPEKLFLRLPSPKLFFSLLPFPPTALRWEWHCRCF